MHKLYNGNLNQHQQALDDFTQAIRLDPDNREAFALRSVGNAHVGNYDAAQQDLERAVSLGYPQSFLEDTIQQIKARR